VTSEIIFRDIKIEKKHLVSYENLPETLKNSNFEILLTAGAGDIANLLPEIDGGA